MNQTEENLRRIRAYNKRICDDAEFEKDHPRNEDGEFTSGGGASKAPENPLQKLAEATEPEGKNMGWFSDLMTMAERYRKSNAQIEAPKTFDKGIERKLAKCKTNDDIKATLKELDFFGEEALNKCVFPEDIEGTKACIRGMGVVLKRYPSMLHSLTCGVQVVPMDEISGSIASYFSKKDDFIPLFGIKLADVGFNDFNGLLEDYAQAVEDKKFPQGTTAHSVTTHEMGHAIVNDIKRNSPKGFDFCRYLYYDVCGIDENATKEDIAELLSSYSFPEDELDFDDFLCEGISEGLTSEAPRELAQKITKAVDEYFAAKDKQRYILNIANKSKKGWVK